MNKVILIGNLTEKPEPCQTPSGVSYTTLKIAVNRKYKDNDGNALTDFFSIKVWKDQAELCCKWLDKGRKIAIVGSIENRSYEDKDGNKKYVTDIVANEVEFLSPSGKKEETENGEDKANRPTVTPLGENDEPLPF